MVKIEKVDTIEQVHFDLLASQNDACAVYDAFLCIKQGSARLYKVGRGLFVVNKLHTQNNAKTLEIAMLGGDWLQHVKSIQDFAEHLARLERCASITLCVRRKATKRIAEKLGYNEAFSVMNKEL